MFDLTTKEERQEHYQDIAKHPIQHAVIWLGLFLTALAFIFFVLV